MPLKNNEQEGFTLVELMVAIALLAIIASLAVPAFRDTIISNSVSFGRDQYFGALTFARSEAIKVGTSVSVCKSANATACDASASWSDGWLAFVDANRDGNLDTGDRIVKTGGPLDTAVTVTHSTSADVVTFDSRGLALRGDGLFTFSHSSGSSFNKTVDLSVTGRAMKGS